ncbi:trypsin-like peptidase domain-containing protein [Acuticoccus sediminis]|uniref:trypsin-like peptidase domain-containing protein n=1 Tax=Acuticoccus sediminis TaxID=2184697 RepID=UPI001391C23C|nr:trypsin-like peptidase domain-containing protein [Acuticoccus sediminis]
MARLGATGIPDSVPDEMTELPKLGEWAGFIALASASVGQIRVEVGGRTFAVGTAFRVGNDDRRVATAAHVVGTMLPHQTSIAAGIDPVPKRRDVPSAFLPAHVFFEAAEADGRAFAAETVDVEAVELLSADYDIMICRLAADSRRPSLRLADPGQAGEDRPMCVVGYPITPRTADKALYDKVFGAAPQTPAEAAMEPRKCASPGLMKRHGTRFSTSHDATTLPGSSGSPCIALDDGGVVGLHFRGRQSSGDLNALRHLALLAETPELAERMDLAANGPPSAPFGGKAATWTSRQPDAAPDDGGTDEGAVPSGAPPAFSASPAVLADRRDIRDRHYRPSLIRAEARVCPEAGTLHLLEQQSDGDCVGYAMAAAINRHLTQQNRLPPGGVSARMIYEMARAHDEFVDDLPAGTSLRGGMKGFFHNGVCPAELVPKTPAFHLTVEMAKAARSVALGAYYRLSASLSDFQMAIQEVGAVVVSARLHSGWAEPVDGRIVNTGERRAGHAFVLVGYDSEGFLVQNSWGPDWGGFDGLKGVAHWSYGDFAQNVIDAWVLQLAPSAPQAHNIQLRAYGPDDPATDASPPDPLAALPEPRRSAIIGHIVHAERSGLVDLDRLGAGQATLRETAMWLADDESWERYPRLVFVFHDPFLGAEAAARLTMHTVERFKAAGTYPINVLYGADELRSLTARMRDEADFCRKISGGAADLTAYLDRRAQVVAKPMLEGYATGLTEAAAPGGALWRVLASIGFEAFRRPKPKGGEDRRAVHVVAFGLGSFAAQVAIASLADAGFCHDHAHALPLGAAPSDPGAPRRKAYKLGSVSLLAPVAPLSAHGDGDPWWIWPKREPAVYTLGPDRPSGAAMPGYRGDWGDLVSALLPATSHRPRGADQGAGRLAELLIDGSVLNDVLRRITGGDSLAPLKRF